MKLGNSQGCCCVFFIKPLSGVFNEVLFKQVIPHEHLHYSFLGNVALRSIRMSRVPKTVLNYIASLDGPKEKCGEQTIVLCFLPRYFYKFLENCFRLSVKFLHSLDTLWL